MLEILNTPLGHYVLFVVASSAVRAMPEPNRPEGIGGWALIGFMFYRWLYSFTHSLLANWDKVLGPKRPE